MATGPHVWQSQAPDAWVYGEPVRGLVRDPLAACLWRPGRQPGAFEGWHWLAVARGPEGERVEQTGRAATLLDGVNSAEERLRVAGLLAE